MDDEINLQNLCIKVIAYEIDTFCDLKNSDDVHLQRKLKFLQKVYAFEILEEIYDNYELEETHMDVLLNKYTKVVYTIWFVCIPWKIVTRKFAEVGSNIKHITIENGLERRSWQHIVPYLSNLESMDFCDSCNDKILKCIAEFCPNIMEIIVKNSPVTNKGVKYLCVYQNGKPLCPMLKRVLISNTRVNFEGVHYLVKNLKTLEETDHPDLAKVILQLQHEKCFPGLHNAEPYNLKRLNLLPHFSDIHNPAHLNLSNEWCIPLCPHLKSLSCLIQKEEHLNLVPYELDELNLEFSLDPKINITNFLKYKGRTLTILVLTDCFLSVSTLAESCPCLTQLHLQKVHFTNYKFSPVFHHLTFCIFEDTINATATVKSICLILTLSPKLWHICFETCNLSSRVLNREILNACKYHPRRKVYISNSAVSIDFAKEFIKDCYSLEEIELINCDINKKDAVEFYSFSATLEKNRVVLENLDDIDEEDKVDFTATLNGEIPEFLFERPHA